MKKILTLTCFLFTTVSLSAQLVTKAEYFFDDGDLGFDSCHTISLTSSADSLWSLQGNISLAGLQVGPHFIRIRVSDDSLNWSQTITRYFEITAASGDSIISGEWFIDDGDLGYDSCQTFMITNPGPDIVTNQIIPNSSFAGLPLGYHNLYYRVKDEDDKWSQTITRNFEIVPEDSLIYGYQVEVIKVSDLGYDSCTIVPIYNIFLDSASVCITVPYSNNWTSGDSLYVRIKDSTQFHWSHTVRVVTQSSNCFSTSNNNHIGLPDFNIFPIPATDMINIEFENSEVNWSELNLINMMGEILQSQQVQDGINHIRLSYSPGIYFIRLSSNEGSITKKIIIQ